MSKDDSGGVNGRSTTAFSKLETRRRETKVGVQLGWHPGQLSRIAVVAPT
jgi:hypothetical protein